MSTWRLLIMIASVFLTAAEGKREYVTSGEQTILDTADHRRYFRYRVRTFDGREVSTFCKTYTVNQLLVWDKSNGAFGYHISCLKQRRNNRKLVIWIHGGPWVHASKDLVLDQLAFMDSGYDLYILLYPGSADRPIKFEGPVMVPDVVDALTELKAAFGWGRKHYERVDVFGESFGAFLAASLAPELEGKNSLFLHNPSLGGQSRLMEYYSGQGEELKIEGIPKEAAQAEAKRITDAYFGRLEGYIPLRLLESTEGLKLKLVHGGRDKLMVPGEIQRLARLAVPGCGVDYRPDNGHESARTPEQYESFRNLIRCGNWQGPHGVLPRRAGRENEIGN